MYMKAENGVAANLAVRAYFDKFQQLTENNTALWLVEKETDTRSKVTGKKTFEHVSFACALWCSIFTKRRT